MPIQTRPLTADQFLEWPDDPGFRQELIRGVVVTLPLAGARHGEVTAEIGCLIGGHVETHGLGGTYAAGTGCIVERDPDTVRGADVSFVSRRRLALIADPEKHLPFAPDLAVEVLWPEDCEGDIGGKIDQWLSAGSLLVWKVDPEDRTVIICRPGAEPVTLREDDEIDGGDVIPGFRCRVADFFA